MAEEIGPRVPASLPRRLTAIALPALALGLLLSWVASAGAHRPDFFVLLGILALPLLAPCWPGAAPYGERLARGGTGLASATVLALTLLRQTALNDVTLTVPLFGLLILGMTLALQAALTPRRALAALHAALALLAGLALARGEDAAQALGATLLTPTPWAILVLAAVGIVALTRPWRRWPHVASYALVIGGLAAFWRWGGPLTELAAIRGGLQPLELRAAGLIPACMLIGGGAQVSLALLLPRAPWSRAARADLCAHLLLIGLPVAAATLPIRTSLPFEGAFRLAWLAWFLVALILARLAVAMGLLLRAADEAGAATRGRETRLALAFFAVCFATYWSAILWRADSFGLIGDEPQYLAATMSLRDGRNLELADSLFSPQMSAVVADPEGERDLHVYEDASADRMLFSRNFGPPRQDLFLPLVASPAWAGQAGLTSTIELFNPNLESAGGTVTFRDPAGQVVLAQPIVVAPGTTLILQPPASGVVALSAAINVGKPILAAARARTPEGSTENYFATVATARHCLPVHLDPARWHARVFVQNGLPNEAEASWTRYRADGATLARGSIIVPPGGVADFLLAPDTVGDTICLTGDGPIATLLLAQAAPGLLIAQGHPAQVARLDIPARHTTLGYLGLRRVVIHNPGGDSIALALDREYASSTQEILIAAHGTWSYDVTANAARITSAEPVMVEVIETIGRHAATVTPEQTAGETLTLPVIDVGRDHYAVSQIELVNRGAGETQATLTLLDGRGGVLWTDKIAVAGDGTTSKAFWYRGADSRVLMIQGRSPLTATLLQREISTASPVHGLGLSLALLPGYALAGYGGVLATAALLAALLALVVYDLLRRLGLDARAALIIAGLLACSSPLAPAAVRLYAEVGGTLLIALALCCADNWRIGRWPAAVAAPLGLLCLGGAVLFHARLLPLAFVVVASVGALLVARLLRGRGGSRSRRWLLLGALLVGGVALLAGAFVLAGRIDPRLRPAYLRDFLLLSQLGPQSLGILFDRASGLFPAVPILLLAASGFGWAIRRVPYLGWTALALCIVQFFAVALRGGGWETWGPPARYIYPAMPFAAMALGAAWCWGFARPVRFLAGALGGVGLLVTAFSWWLPLGLHYGIALPTAYWFTDVVLPAFLGANPFRLFPALVSVVASPLRPTLPWLALVALGLLLGLPWHRLRPARLRRAAPPHAQPGD